MKIIKADNYQTWYIEEKNKSIIIDPWLTNSLQPDKSFFIQRKKKIARPRLYISESSEDDEE